MKTKILCIVALLMIVVALLVACDSSSTKNPATTTTTENQDPPIEDTYVDPTINCVNIYEISVSVQEMSRSEHDKYVDKTNDKWEKGWKSSTLSPTSQIKIGVNNGTIAHKVDNFNETCAVGIDSTTVTSPLGIFLELYDESVISENKCELNLESIRTYKGISSGAIGSGMLIVEKSYDKTSWSRLDSVEYQNGLFTTNYRTHYGVNRPVTIYTPSGSDLNRGVYIRITYVYEAKHTYTGKNIFGFDKTVTEAKMFREQGVFYLCNENIDGVTLHNLSLTNDDFPEDAIDESGEVSVEYKKAETLTNDATTFTGFKIDNSMSQVDVAVTLNDYRVDIPQNGEFKESGKYDIVISQKLGKKQKKVTIYVDNRSVDELVGYYFGEGFISGKRIYWEGDYPMFEGGLTNYFVSEVEATLPAIYGSITNTTSGETIKINGNRIEASGTLDEAGEYIATFYNNPTFSTDIPSGDTFVVTYRFVLIANGTAPGPQVNKSKLSEYATTNVSDYYPKYYGVTYKSAGPGDITLVFSNYEDAFEFAYNYEKGCVEKQSDGSYRYYGTLTVGVKVIFDSVWDLTDATNYFAEQAVQELFFDITDEFTYLTLAEDVLKECDNLRTLELSKSVVVFADEEQRLGATAGNGLPVISAKKYQYLTPGLDGTVTIGTNDFEFIKDENGYDSETVVIVDANGKEINIEYNRGVAEQLKAAGCATGIITIKEETVYGDSTEYNAIYFEEGVNTTKATFNCHMDGKIHVIYAYQSSPENVFEVNSFSFDEVSDELDPMALVKVIKDGEAKLYTLGEAEGMIWSTPGEYTVIFINRLGYTYQFEFSIKENHFINIEFSGIGTETLEQLVVTRDQTNVSLPLITRYGYLLAGYEDQNGNIYTTVVNPSSLEEDLTLSPIWEAKAFTLTVKNNEGEVLQTLVVKFGENYVLVRPTLSNGETFIGWVMNGQTLEDGSITVSEEGDIVIIADIYVPDVPEEKPETQNPETQNPETQNPGNQVPEYTGPSGSVNNSTNVSTDSGCGSFLSLSGMGLVLIIGSAFAMLLWKRKED